MAARVLRRRCFVLSWFLLGGLTWFLPLVLFLLSRWTHHLPDNYDGMRLNGYNNNDDYRWGSYAGKNDDDDIRWKHYRSNNCNWLFGCQYQDHNVEEPPRWWKGARESSQLSSPLRAALALVYLGSSAMFAGILYFGYRLVLKLRFEQFQRLDPLVPLLIMFAGFTTLTMILVGNVSGMVDTYGKQFLQYGFYGQLAILLYVTAFLWTIFCVAFACVIKTQLSRICFFPEDSIENYELQHDPVEEARGVPSVAAFSPRRKAHANDPVEKARGTPKAGSRVVHSPSQRPSREEPKRSDRRPTNPLTPDASGKVGLKSLHQRRWEEAVLVKSRSEPLLDSKFSGANVV